MKNIFLPLALLAGLALAGCGKPESPTASRSAVAPPATTATAPEDMDDPEFESLPDLHEDSREW